MRKLALFLLTAVCVHAQQASIFKAGPDMTAPRMGHHAVTFSDGKTVLFGGHGTNFVSLASADVLNSEGTAFTTLTMQYTHDMPALARLADGRIFLAGGSVDLGIPQYATSELYNHSAGTFTAAGSMVRFRAGAGAIQLVNTNILIAGAWWTHNDAHTYGEIFNVTTPGFTATKALNNPRSYPIVVPLDNGKALVLGGAGITGGAAPETIEQYDPATDSFSVLQSALFTGETGWAAGGSQSYMRPVTDQKCADGRYLFLATKASTPPQLYTVNPTTGTIAKVMTAGALSATISYYPPLVDTSGTSAYLLGITGTSGVVTYYNLFRVSPVTGALSDLGSDSLAWSTSGMSVCMRRNGSILLSGGSSSANGSNFTPVVKTRVIIPGDAVTEISKKKGLYTTGKPVVTRHGSKIVVNVPAIIDGAALVTVTNCKGQVILSAQRGELSGTQPLVLQDLADGLYILRITSPGMQYLASFALTR